MPIDYWSLWILVSLLLLIPLMHTKWWIDIYLIPVYTYAAVAAFSPIYFKYPSKHLLILIQGHQHFFLAMCLGLVLFLKAKVSPIKIKRALGYFGFAAAICTVVFYFVPWVNLGASNAKLGSMFVPNTAMNASMIVCLLPFMFSLGIGYELMAVVLTFVIVYKADSSTGLLTLLALIAACVCRAHILHRTIVLLCAAILFFLFGRYITAEFYNDGGRFDSYFFFFREFTYGDWLIGRGPGSFQEWSALLQYAYDYEIHNGYSIFMHSDPLQLVWELGLIMIPSAVISGWQLLKRAHDPVFLSLFAFFVSSIFYYPFHNPVLLTIFFCLVKVVIDNGLAGPAEPG